MQPIRDSANQVIATFHEIGIITYMCDVNDKVLGRYEGAELGYTFDANGNMVGRGNQLIGLLH
jgi:hypothetical protein